MRKEMTKSLPVSKRMVWESYLNVISKDGGAGIDGQSIEMFNADMSANLYKLWNRMSSGSYFPPAVRTVLIPKKQGGLRPLGIPTIADRIAQGVVKDYLEPKIESLFHPSSFGYRPGKNAHQALEQCHRNCMTNAWVVDVDIKGFFDNINHDLMMELLKMHSDEKWVLLYVERWLKAGVEQSDKSIEARTKGTPQGGVISPLLANIYLHHAFDKWISEMYPQSPFERYADDIVIHCASKESAEQILAELQIRMSEFELTLHPEKTKIVYCKSYQRPERHENESFIFLGNSFEPTTIKSRKMEGTRFLIFAGDICNAAKTSIRSKIKEVLNPQWSNQTLEGFAQRLNPKIRGWVNYYTKFNRQKVEEVFYYLNDLIQQWMKHKYKIGSKKRLYDKYYQFQTANPDLFYHWKLEKKKK
jgi:RNA-directed DNA polymerase